MCDVQGDFMPGKNCVSQISAPCMAVEKCHSAVKKVVAAFVDIEKA